MKRDPCPQEYAGFIRRAVAFSVDLIIVGLILLVAAAPASAVGAFFPRRVFAGLHAAVSAAVAIFSVVFGAVYLIACWTLLGQTPGMMLMGLRVARTDGQAMTLGRALCRYLGLLLSALPLCLGFFWILIDARRQGWHDKLGGTVVTYVPRRAARSGAMASDA